MMPQSVLSQKHPEHEMVMLVIMRSIKRRNYSHINSQGGTRRLIRQINTKILASGEVAI